MENAIKDRRFDGGKIKHLREQEGWSQIELAFRAGFQSTSNIRAWEEKGSEPVGKNLLKLADVFGVSPSYFYEETGNG